MPVEAVLRRDPGNPFDSNAIAVHVGSALVGHITREVAAQRPRSPSATSLRGSTAGER